MQRHLKSLLLAMADGAGVFAARRSRTRSRLRVVTYHGVDDAGGAMVNMDRLQTPVLTFARHLESLARAFQVVDLREAVRRFSETGAWPDRALAVTFDDGYLNNLEQAAPILRKLGVPATFFVTAGFIDGYARPWWYDLRQWLARQSLPEAEARRRAVDMEAKLRPMAEERRDARLNELGVPRDQPAAYPFMNRDHCRQLIGMGFDVQCHGDTHASFYGETTDRVATEIRKSAAFVRALGHAPWALAYPYGHEPRDGQSAREVMNAEGIMAALTTREGNNGRDADLYQLRRWDLHGGYSPRAALARVS